MASKKTRRPASASPESKSAAPRGRGRTARSSGPAGKKDAPSAAPVRAAKRSDDIKVEKIALDRKSVV